MIPLLFGLIGLVVGGVLGVLADVVPDSINDGHSPLRCSRCNTERGIRGLSPIRFNGSECPECGQDISVARLPVVVTTAVVFALTAGIIGPRWQLLPLLLFASSLIALSAVDMVRYRLPDRIIFPAFVLSVVVLGALSASVGDIDHLVRGLIAAFAYAGFLFVFNVISPAGLAFGDVKLSLLLGLFLGWSADSGLDAARLVIWALILGMILGVFSGLFVGIGRRVFGPDFLADPDFPPAEDGSLDPLLKTAFPFGPALALSAFSLVVFSERVLAGSGILA